MAASGTTSSAAGRTAAGQIRHGRLGRSHPVGALGKLVGVVVAVVLISTTGVAAYALHDVVTSTKPPVHLAQLPGHTATPLPSAPAGESVGEVNMLVIGSDTRSGQAGYGDAADQAASQGAGNNDVNILLHISADHKSASVVSFPRDLEIPIPACPTAGGGYSYASSQDMLNTALSRGGDEAHGLQCAVLTIEKLTGLNIPYAASVTFAGTAAISTAVGGVNVCLATPIVDDNVTPALNLSAGEHTLVGGQALAFLRSRHGVGDGSDLGRISNQQVFMSSLARQLTSSGTLSNPFTLYKIAKAVTENTTYSDTVTPSFLLGVFQAVRTVGLSNMVFLQYPVGEDPTNINRVIPSEYAAQQVNQALVADQPLVLTGTTGDGASVQPSSSASPSTSASASASPSTSSAPTSTPTTSAGSTSTVTLPPSVTGQTAAQKTCSKKIQY
ncbi:hypothetical protein AX769_20345 [Frondihabitans sp. PAMC 28766]|uniref:LCP family protein n=1 Tax=Frondihabitans sp. PAMC 28766 TaxID=1795630 RepID=UPI00078EBA1E|nr:LCP family protein [Frondihabitans sp. PAMC 28766]AMM22068.1 hypothetical protein AX769_20345 [Frondihabitans sp. PAMC 28766]